MSVPKGCLRTDRRAGSLRKMGAVCIFFRKFAPETKTIHDMAITEIRPGIHYVGVNDRTTTRFEGLWPLPIGVSYNSYLVVGEQVALIDTVEESFGSRLFENIREVIGDRKIDYLVVNHMEPDHSSSIAALRLRYPDLKIVGNAKTLQMIGGYYGIDAGTLEVKEGDTLDLGAGKLLTFHLIPMVHWPETMVTWYAAEGVIFSGDAFGTFGALDGGITDSEVEVDRYWDEMRRYYACIVGKYGAPVQKALQKVGGLEIRTICPTHGPVWQERIGEVVALYDRMSRYEGEPGAVIAYGSMYGNTEQMAEAIAAELSAQGIKNIVMHNVSKSNPSYIIADIFKYRGLIIGSPTYSNQIYPEIESLLSKILVREVKGRYLGYFGSFCWAGAAVKRMGEFAEKSKFEIVGDPVEMKQAMKDITYEQCENLARAMAERLKKDRQ